MGALVVFIVTAVIAVLIMKFVFHVTIGIFSFLINSLIGAVTIWVLNLFGLGITINWLTAAIVGFLGVPGVIIVLILKFVFHIV